MAVVLCFVSILRSLTIIKKKAKIFFCNFADMNTKTSIEKENKKVKEIKKRNVLSFLLFLLLVLVCTVLHYVLPTKAESKASEPAKPSTTLVK